MAITTIPVGLEYIFFIAAAEDYQRNDTGERRLSYDGEHAQLDISISAYVTERGLRSLASQAVTLEVPVAEADEQLKALRSLPAQTRVSFKSLTSRSGVSRSGSAYSMWTGRGISVVRAAGSTPRHSGDATS